MNSSKGRKITRKGSHHSHGEGWLYPWCGDRKFAKKEARRAQRRDGHKEISEQLLYGYWTKSLGFRYGIDSTVPPNMFAPVPVWLMSEWEKAGMEHFRLLRSRYGWFKGVRGWAEDAYQQRVLSHCDETLFEDLKRSVNQYAHMKSAKEEW